MPSPTVYKRPNSPYWWISRYYIDTDGKRKRVLTSGQKLGLEVTKYSKEEALVAINAYYSSSSTGNEQATTGTLIWILDEIEHLCEITGLREGTIIKYRKAIRNLIDLLSPDFPVADITKRPHVEQYKRHLLEKHYSPSTVNSHCQAVQASLSKLVDQGNIDTNPFDRFKKLPEPESASMTVDETVHFLEAVENWQPDRYRNPPEYYEGLKRLVWIYLYTARRRAEVLEIHRDDIDLDAGTIKIPNIKKRRRPKDTIDIAPQILDDITWFLEHFPGRNFPFKICQPDTITRYTKRWLREAGLPEELHHHSLRHTTLTLAAEKMQNVRAIQRYVGHSTIEVTERYLHEKSKGSIDLGYDFTVHKGVKKS